MNILEETIDATLDANGGLRLTHPPRLSPGPVRVTIRVSSTPGSQRGLADVVREIQADQAARGFQGRAAADIAADDEAGLTEDADRDQELDSARGSASPGMP